MRRPDRHARAAAIAGLVLGALLAAHAAPPDIGLLVERRRQAFDALGTTRQATFRQRLDAWEQLPPAEAGARRERYLAFQALDGVDRALVRDARERFEAMSPARQAELRERFAELDVAMQRGWMLGPRLGADFAALSPLLLQVPGDQREPLLATLRDMTAEQRADLAVLAHRTPPQERDALRQALIGTTRENRAAWLDLRLAR